MKFTEIRNTLQSFSGASIADYQLAYIATEVRDILNELDNRYVEYLTNDIVDTAPLFELQDWLGPDYYQSSNENAKDCLEQCPKVKHIWGRKIKSWTDSALKCFDNFLLKFIQLDKGEIIPKGFTGLKETDVYNYLINKGGKEQDIGQNFKTIYQIRSTFQHIQVEQHNGIRVPKRMSNSHCNKLRDMIISCFSQALFELLVLIDDQRRLNSGLSCERL